MAKVIQETIGSSHLLQFEFRLDTKNKEKQDVAWGEGSLRFQGEELWISQEDGKAPTKVTWSWLDLLEFLARAWPWLLLEESYPVPVTPLNPGKLRQAVTRRWENLAHETVLQEDEEVFRFESHHDLSRGMKGIHLPSTILLRQGLQMWVCTPEKATLAPFEDVLNVLEKTGDFLANVLVGSTNPRTENVVRIWNSRKEKILNRLISLRTGLPFETLSMLQGNQDADSFWEADAADNYWDSEVLAAARMSAKIIGFDEQRALLDAIRQLRKNETPILDKLSVEAKKSFDETAAAPHELGYDLAKWLRRKLKLEDTSKVDPAEILQGFKVPIENIILDNCPVDAIACWGKHHGPAIILNEGEGSRPNHPHGRRSSLAHEICHLLVDRHKGLQVAEVLGGLAPAFFERRANAFAAEFLLPQKVVSDCIKKGTDFRSVVAYLSNAYAVSFQLVGWQIKNSPIYYHLSTGERAYVDQITSDPSERNVAL